ncbi:MAG TPA: acyl carrier protein [Xanthobacteraceae bacterium]|nr:acyl carrier protein [Xanthobacteraceae bacterium]
MSPAKAADCTEAVTEIVAKHLDIPKGKVVPKASLEKDLGADSLDTVELVMAMEEEFNAEITDEVAEKLITVADFIQFANKHPSNRCR